MEGQALFGTFRKIRFVFAPCNKALPLTISLYYLLPFLELLVSFQNFEDGQTDCRLHSDFS